MTDVFTLNLDDSHGLHGGVLPLRLLVLGHFVSDLSLDSYYGCAPVAITQRNFEHVLTAQSLHIELQLSDSVFANQVLQALGKKCFNWQISSLQDFGAEGIVVQEDALAFLVSLLSRLIAFVELPETIASAPLTELELSVLGVDQLGDDLSIVNFLIADLRFNLNLLLNDLMHHPSLQRLEAAWRGLHWLARVAADHPLCEICFLPATKAVLREDFQNSASLEETHLYELVYANEYGQYGGQPYAAMVTDFEVDHSQADLQLLKDFAGVSQMAHAPLICAARPNFFGVDSYAEMANIASLEEVQQLVAYQRWREFQQQDISAYVMLTLPRVLLRGKSHLKNSGADHWLYSEDVSQNVDDCLWGSAAFAFAVNSLQSFKKHQMCTQLCGEEGVVSGLDIQLPMRALSAIPPIEVILSENKNAELIRLGFTPLSVNKHSGDLLFSSANSIHWGHCTRLQKNNRVDDINVLLQAQFSYLFVILRVAQYLKVLSRSFVGSLNSVPELEAALNKWLRSYVSDVENPSADVRARRPLHKVALRLSADNNALGGYQAHLSLTPHTQYLGKYFQLSLAFDVASPQPLSEAVE